MGATGLPRPGRRGELPTASERTGNERDSSIARREGLAVPRAPTEWVVDCRAVGSGAQAFTYLGRYLYRGVIREEDLLSCAQGQVTFRYREAKSGKLEERTLPGEEFLWLVLQHVLPKGFRRARNFGFLHPNAKGLIALLHWLLKFDPAHYLAAIKPRAPMLCPCCGAVMKIVRTRLAPASSRPPSPLLDPRSALMA